MPSYLAHVAGGTVAVVGDGFHDHGHAAGRIAFVGDGFVVHIAQLAGSLLDGALDIIVGHVVALGLGDDVAQLGVAFGIAAAFAHGDGDFTADLGKDLAAGRVGLALLHCDIMPFAVSGHGYQPFFV